MSIPSSSSSSSSSSVPRSLGTLYVIGGSISLSSTSLLHFIDLSADVSFKLAGLDATPNIELPDESLSSSSSSTSTTSSSSVSGSGSSSLLSLSVISPSPDNASLLERRSVTLSAGVVSDISLLLTPSSLLSPPSSTPPPSPVLIVWSPTLRSSVQPLPVLTRALAAAGQSDARRFASLSWSSLTSFPNSLESSNNGLTAAGTSRGERWRSKEQVTEEKQWAITLESWTDANCQFVGVCTADTPARSYFCLCSSRTSGGHVYGVDPEHGLLIDSKLEEYAARKPVALKTGDVLEFAIVKSTLRVARNGQPVGSVDLPASQTWHVAAQLGEGSTLTFQ